MVRFTLGCMLIALAAGPAPASADPAEAAGFVLGVPNQLLADGSNELAAGHFEEGVRLTLAGLERPNNTWDEASGHSNACAGFAALKRWTEALEHCNRALEIDRGNWRTFNNRAAVFVGLGQFDLALADVNAGLALAPGVDTLHKSLEVVKAHQQSALRDRRKRPIRA